MSGMFKLLVIHLKRSIRNIMALSRVLNANPRISLAPGVTVLGDPAAIRIGRGAVIEQGVVFDLRNGGKVVLGERTTIRRGAIINPHGGTIEIGCDCGVNCYSILYGHGGLRIGNNVWFAAQCIVIPANHGVVLNAGPIYSQPLTTRGIVVGDDVWVGGGVQILDGVTIGAGAVVAAGAVVNRDVPSDSIFGGVPARLLGNRKSPH